MATEAQTRANRLNSLKSTGPRTPEGKDASRRNAARHGLAGVSDFLGDADANLVEARVAAYFHAYRPADAFEEELARRMAVDDLRADRCRALYFLLIRRHADRARGCWDLDARAGAEGLAARLPRDPGRAAAALQATRHGCELLIERWEGLGRALEHAGPWDEARRSMALDLLGVHPKLRAGPTAVDAPEGSDPVAFGLALVASEVARLRELKAEALDAWDESERAVAEEGLGAERSPEMALLLRYESAVYRRYDAARKHFLTRDRRGPSPEPAPVPAPEPPPPPSAPSRGLGVPRLADAMPDEPAPDPDPEPAPASPPSDTGRPQTKRQRRLQAKRLRDHQRGTR